MTGSKQQRGMSLIELMVAMALGVFLMAGVINVFLANKDSTQLETSLARLQENGRIALDLLASDIRDAHFIGCNTYKATLVEMVTNETWNRGLRAYERTAGGWTPALPSHPDGNGLDVTVGATNRVGSDVLNVQLGRRLGVTSSAAVFSFSTAVDIPSNPDCVSKGDWVVMAGCSNAHWFEVTNTPACDGSATTLAYDASANSITAITPDYPAGSDLYRFFDTTWYVRDTGRTRTVADIPVFALFRRVNGTEDEMVEGVEYLQILYGQQVGAGRVRYVPADDANLDLDDVVSVRVAVLMQSFEPVLDADDDNAYQVLDESIGSADTTYTHNGDMTLRRVFETTVLIKNVQVSGS